LAESLIRLFRVLMSPKAKEEAARVLDSGYVGEGPEVEEFERELAVTLGSAPEEVVTVNSCTSALTLALHLAGAGPGDEVVTTPMTCAATNCAVVTRGARPVWADIDPESGLISPADVAKKVGPRTKAVMGVDWGGRVCDYAALRAAAPGIPIIGDAAQRAPLRPEPAGSDAARPDYLCFSFQAIKFVTTCDGGALVCKQPDADRARLLRWYGMSRRVSGDARVQQPILDAGYKFHMNDVAAAVGRANLPQARWAVERHRANALRYRDELAGLPSLKLPSAEGDAQFWLYTLLVEDPGGLIAHLAAHGVEASRVHMRNDRHPALGAATSPLPGVDAFSRREVAVPVGWWLSDEDRDRVVSAVRSWALRARS
jgi:dTDP-4-amino-4,6-dideoxygalactose transaminase